MNYGLYVSASGMMVNLYRQDVFANNLANVETDGFKPRIPTVKQRAPAAIEDKLSADVSKRMLDKLGGGVLAGPSRVNFAPAPLKHTGNPLDVALSSRNTFFAVRYQGGANGPGQVGLTRDGRLTRNAQGELVTPAGNAILNPHDRPIVVSGDAPVTINGAGQVMQAGHVVDQLQVARVANTSVLRKRGNNIFAIEGKDQRQILKNPSVRPGFVESSGVDPIEALMRLMSATKAVSANANMIKYADQLTGEAINQLGKVA